MSDFSDFLNQYIKIRHARVPEMAFYCGIERSAMYKILRGSRSVSDKKKLRRMADYLNLSQSERTRLIECWEIEHQGYDCFYRRRSVEEFLTHFHSTTADASGLPILRMTDGSTADDLEQEALSVPLHGPKDIRRAASLILMKELLQPDARLLLQLQPDMETIINLINALGDTHRHLVVEHIVKLYAGNNYVVFNRDPNIDTLTQLLTMQMHHYHYLPRYYYGHRDEVHGSSDFSAMMITSERALIFTSDLKEGILTRQENIVELLRDRFNRLKEKSDPVYTRITGIHEYMEVIEKNGAFDGGFSYGISMQPHLDLFVTDGMMRRYLRPGMEELQQMLPRLKSYLNYCHEDYKKRCPVSYVPLAAVERFLVSGIYDNFTPAFFEPPGMKDRIWLVRAMLNAPELNNVHYLKKNWFTKKDDLILYVSASKGFIRFTSPNDGNLVFLQLKEPQLLRSFCDFFEHMDEELICTPEEARAGIEEMIRNCSDEKDA